MNLPYRIQAHMRKYDLIVIGTGAGMNVAANAAAHGMRVVERTTRRGNS